MAGKYSHETGRPGKKYDGHHPKIIRDFYDSGAWRKASTAYLKSRRYICEVCGDVATETHHKDRITPTMIKSGRTDLLYGEDNLLAVCHRCHTDLHRNGGKPRRYRVDEEGNVIPNPNWTQD